jgi:hypothetical protein
LESSLVLRRQAPVALDVRQFNPKVQKICSNLSVAYIHVL